MNKENTQPITPDAATEIARQLNAIINNEALPNVLRHGLDVAITDLFNDLPDVQSALKICEHNFEYTKNVLLAATGNAAAIQTMPRGENVNHDIEETDAEQTGIEDDETNDAELIDEPENEPEAPENLAFTASMLNSILNHPAAPPELRAGASAALLDIERAENLLPPLDDLEDDQRREISNAIRVSCGTCFAPDSISNQAAKELSELIHLLFNSDSVPAFVHNQISLTFDEMSMRSPLNQCSDWTAPSELKKILLAHCNDELPNPIDNLTLPELLSKAFKHPDMPDDLRCDLWNFISDNSHADIDSPEWFAYELNKTSLFKNKSEGKRID